MPNPKRRHSHSRSGKRRGGKEFAVPDFSICPNCKALKPSHAMCPACNYYKGQLVVTPREKKKTAER